MSLTSVVHETRSRRENNGLDAVLGRVVHPEDTIQAEATVPRQLDGAGDFPAVDEQVWLAHVCYARTRDAGLRRVLVEEYRSYVLSLATQMYREGEPREDLAQVAFEGLLLAFDRFDPARGIPFVGFATPTILGGLKRHYRDTGWLLRVPRRVHELVSPARRASEELSVELGREPSPSEVAARLGVDVEDLLIAEEASSARSTMSLDLPPEDGTTPYDLIGGLDPEIAHLDNVLSLRQALGELSDRDQETIRRYFFENQSQDEIARAFGVSQMQVSRWIASSLARLRSWLPAD